jgi:hypothetical protein
VGDLVEKVARATAKASDCTMSWFAQCDIKPECPCRVTAGAAIAAVLEAIAEPTDAMGAAGLIATNGDSLNGWSDEERRAAFIALGNIGYGDRISGNPSKWMKPVWRAMIAALKKELEDG